MLPAKTRCHVMVSVTMVAISLAGCAIPNTVPKTHPLKGTAIGLQGPDAAPTAGWWRGMNDPQLDRIMADALSGNPTLDEVLARLRLANARVETQGSQLLPQIAIDGQEQRSRLSGAYTIPPPYAGSTRWVGSIQTSLSWTLDFAGKQRAMIDQASGAANAAAFEVAAARLALTGAVAQTYAGLARAEEQIRIADAFVQSRKESLTLARIRARNDLDSDFDIHAAETLLAQAQQSLDRANGERALMIHALATLAGRGADAYPAIAPATLRFDAALMLPATLPANLLDRRPDILAARARIDAAGAGRDAARADFYPSVDLRAFLGVSSVEASSLLSSRAFTYGVGPAVHIPIFEGGRLRAQYNAATAELDTATANYNTLALHAVQEAADALSTIDSNAAQSADQQKIVTGLAETERLDRVRARTGLGTQLDILASGDRLLQARQAQADLNAEGLVRRIQLLVAVGGDFSPGAQVKLAADGSSGANTEGRP